VGEFLPKVSAGIFLSVVSNILEGNSAVLVIKKVVGIVTKKDLMKIIKD
jgi:predicted transcriptional regulator